MAQTRSDETTRQLPILTLFEPSERGRAVKALELGANDLLARPIDPEEMAARVRTLIRHKRYTDFLRHNLDHSLELAVTDPLTGLLNRRYMSGQLGPLVSRARTPGAEPVAALLVDIDHFKRINDTFGHDVGDEVLREFAVRLATNVRAIDLACRLGGEEFVVIMPDTDMASAEAVAERVRQAMAERMFEVNAVRPLSVTVSIGVSRNEMAADTSEILLKRADVALYRAKREGRNRVIFDAA